MSRPKLKLSVSDFHMGKGPFLSSGARNYLEDFFYDQRFAEFLEFYGSGDCEKAEVELVICGDFFNHLQVDPQEINPEFITERVALARTGAIVDGHPVVFEALKEFASKPNHKVTFLIGNHDVGLFWPSVRHFVCERIGGNVRVHDQARYITDKVCFEHGNQHVPENWIDYDKPIVKENTKEPIINLPWGDLFVIHFLNRMKRTRPYIDKVFPFRMYLTWAILHDTRFAFRTMFAGFGYFLKVLLQIGENKRFRVKQTLRILKNFSFPVRMKRAAWRTLRDHPECRIVVFGHGHRCATVQFRDGREYFNNGIWNEMISLDVGTMGRSLRLTFVEIRYDKGGIPQGVLKEWKGRYREVEDIIVV